MPSERSSSEPAVATDLEALLQPTLKGRGQTPAPYSVRANFLVAFFGGVYATLLFSWLNSRRLGRAREDGWFYALIAVLWTGAVMSIAYLVALDRLPSWLAQSDRPARDIRYFGRVVALIVFGVIYLRLRRFFKAAQIAGVESPSPWKPALAIIAGAMVLSFVAAAGGAMLAGTVAR